MSQHNGAMHELRLISEGRTDAAITQHDAQYLLDRLRTPSPSPSFKEWRERATALVDEVAEAERFIAMDEAAGTDATDSYKKAAAAHRALSAHLDTLPEVVAGEPVGWMIEEMMAGHEEWLFTAFAAAFGEAEEKAKRVHAAARVEGQTTRTRIVPLYRAAPGKEER